MNIYIILKKYIKYFKDGGVLSKGLFFYGITYKEKLYFDNFMNNKYGNFWNDKSCLILYKKFQNFIKDKI